MVEARQETRVKVSPEVMGFARSSEKGNLAFSGPALGCWKAKCSPATFCTPWAHGQVHTPPSPEVHCSHCVIVRDITGLLWI